MSRNPGHDGARRALAATAVVVASLVATAYAAASGPAARASASKACGTVPSVKPDNPYGALALLPKQDAVDYTGFADNPVWKSPWSNWKPKAKGGKFTVAIVYGPAISPFQAASLAGLESELKSTGKVTIVSVTQPDSPTDVPQQLAQYTAAVQEHPDLIVYEPLAPAPAASGITAAGKQGIPTVVVFGSAPTKYAVAVSLNPYLNAAIPAAGVAKLMGGKGSVLEVHGIPGVTLDVDSFDAFADVLARCPNITVAGSVDGDFVNAAAQGAVLQFLATHPSGVQGVFQDGVMGQGVESAFESSGGTVPPMADIGTSQGTIAYWYAHRTTYHEVGTGTDDTSVGTTTGDVVLRMLAGEGVKVSDILSYPLVIDAANLDKVYSPGYSESSDLDAGIPGTSFMSDSYLNGFFKRPKKP